LPLSTSPERKSMQHLTLAVVIALFACLGLYITDQQRAIELVSLAFFAAFGALSGTFDFAGRWLARQATGAPNPVFEAWRQPRLLLIWPICAFSLAAGGGVIRRSLEIGIAALLLSCCGIRMLECYNPPLTVFWAWGHPYYWAIGVGGFTGAVLAFLLTFRISDVVPVQMRADHLVEAVDSLVSAFFAAYGIEAAVKFLSALPLYGWSTVWFLFWTVVSAFASAGLMATGGGLLKGILLNLLLWEFRNIPGVFRNWFTRPTLGLYGALGSLGFVFYELLDRSPLSFATCPQINSGYMFGTMVFCAMVGMCTYIMTD
jgi:hypothetical protein